MRPVAPRTGAPEITIAEEQEEYRTLTGALYDFGQPPRRGVLTRWTLTAEERARIAAGEDLYVCQLTFGGPLQPITLQVGPAEPTDYRAPEDPDANGRPK